MQLLNNLWVDLSTNRLYNMQYKDWYYLNMEKGEYYRCSSCKQQKLKHHFSSPKKNVVSEYSSLSDK